MNLEKTIKLLGDLQTLVAVLGDLPEPQRGFVAQTLRNNRLECDQLLRAVVKAKHALQDIPAQNFEPMVAISTVHLHPAAREVLLAMDFDRARSAWGMPVYANEYGAFVGIVKGIPPYEDAPPGLADIYAWALGRGLVWVKFDCDAAPVDGLPTHELDESIAVDALSATA